MKTYIATFFRVNPQLKNGGYETTREIEAKTIVSARKKAEKIADNVSYGRLVLKDVVLQTENN